MMNIFHILINSADTDEMPLVCQSACLLLLPVPRQLKFTKIIQACGYYCILHMKRFNRADNMFIGSNQVGSQPVHTWNTSSIHWKRRVFFQH